MDEAVGFSKIAVSVRSILSDAVVNGSAMDEEVVGGSIMDGKPIDVPDHAS